MEASRNSNTLDEKEGLTVYLHFSFRKPKDEKYAFFSCVCFYDREFKKMITKYVTTDVLWYPSSQHINSIQSYYMALNYIFNHQNDMIRNGISRVILVTNNSSLTNWILGRGRNKYYREYISKVCEPFRFGCAKEIGVGVGILEAVDKELSKRYCHERYADNLEFTKQKLDNTIENKSYKLEVGMKSIFDYMQSDNEPEIAGGLVEL